MQQARLDVVGIGNAIVDVISTVDDPFISTHSLNKGAMTLIDTETADQLYDAMPPGIEMSGGSAANTMAGIASLGGKAGFIGKVRDDQLGRIFRHDVGAVGVDFATPPADGGTPTARCLIVVTPDAQRTMNTYLGACVELTPDDVDPDVIADSQVTYMEGYLWDPPQAKQAFLKAGQVAHDAGRSVALTLSDGFCVDRHRDEFRDLVANHVDILFANEDEILSLYQLSEFDEALQIVRGQVRIAALTRSEKGSVVVGGDEVHVLDAEPVDRVVDTTGAGDLYAAGFLYGLTQGRNLHDCGRMGGIAAAEIISHVGARPAVPLAKLVADKMG